MGPALSVATHLPHPPPTTPCLVSLATTQLLLALKMMHSIYLEDDDPEADLDWHRIEHAHAGPPTPSTPGERPQGEADLQPHHYEDTSGGSDDEYGGSTQVAPRKKKGGYDSRIEQILYENPDLPILIVDAGKSVESGGKYIVYTIRTGVSMQSLHCTSI
jgi:hypothetical protein